MAAGWHAVGELARNSQAVSGNNNIQHCMTLPEYRIANQSHAHLWQLSCSVAPQVDHWLLADAHPGSVNCTNQACGGRWRLGHSSCNSHMKVLGGPTPQDVAVHICTSSQTVKRNVVMSLLSA